jgi:pyridoxine/pyridoxamine 5'-phosphate oxidase
MANNPPPIRKEYTLTAATPITDIDLRHSSPGATPTPWATAKKQLERAEIYWLATVRPDGRPHVTPLIAIWHDGTFYFCTGADERKARNIAQNAHCTITTGCNTSSEGLDIVIEGSIARVSDEPTLRRIAGAYEAKYGSVWHWDVRDSAFHGNEGNVALVFAVTPAKAFGFGKGEPASQTRWRFQ